MRLKRLHLPLGITPAARQAGYRSKLDECIHENVLVRLRSAASKGWAFGEGDFVKRLASLANRATQGAVWGESWAV